MGDEGGCALPSWQDPRLIPPLVLLTEDGPVIAGLRQTDNFLFCG